MQEAGIFKLSKILDPSSKILNDEFAFRAISVRYF